MNMDVAISHSDLFICSLCTRPQNVTVFAPRKSISGRLTVAFMDLQLDAFVTRNSGLSGGSSLLF